MILDRHEIGSVHSALAPAGRHEGYPDCGHDGLARLTAYSSTPAPSKRAYGSLWRPSRAR